MGVESSFKFGNLHFMNFEVYDTFFFQVKPLYTAKILFSYYWLIKTSSAWTGRLFVVGIESIKIKTQKAGRNERLNFIHRCYRCSLSRAA